MYLLSRSRKGKAEYLFHSVISVAQPAVFCFQYENKNRIALRFEGQILCYFVPETLADSGCPSDMDILFTNLLQIVPD